MSKTNLLLHKLNGITSTALKQIATRCGIASSGTKPILANRIANELQTPLLQPLTQNTPHRILSIDMGIRNLALCLIHIPNTQPPQISHWKRVTVSPKPDSPAIIESFEPLDFAAKAYSLMKSSLDEYNPHTILIERQRYRSGNAAAVQEWTVRVNMLESMFHAVLYTLGQHSQKAFQVHSVSPRRMTQYWLADVEEKMNARETKMAKIGVAERIVKGDELRVEFSGEADDVARAFRESKKRGEAGIKKFDDLADSMLQGLGWWKWHVNRLRTIEEVLSWEEVTKKAKSEATRKNTSQKTKKPRKSVKLLV